MSSQEPNFNGLTPGEAERLALLAEECGEVIQAVGKILRHGYESHDPAMTASVPTNRQSLELEIGHVLAARDLLAINDEVRLAEISRYSQEKFARVGRWPHYTHLALARPAGNDGAVLMPDEFERMRAAYEVLRGIDRHEWDRVIRWLDRRLRSDMRTASAGEAHGVEPERWEISGTGECSSDGPEEVAAEFCETGEVMEIDGVAVVQRRFAVRHQIGNGEDDIAWFDTRGEAEAFVASLSLASPQEFEF